MSNKPDHSDAWFAIALLSGFALVIFSFFAGIALLAHCL